MADFSELQEAAGLSAAELKERLPLAWVLVSEGIEVVAGSDGKLRAKCPFHDDTDPSLDLWGDNRFGCFPCGAQGDVLDFIARRYDLTSRQFPLVIAKAQEFLAAMPEGWTPPQGAAGGGAGRTPFDAEAARDFLAGCYAAGGGALTEYVADVQDDKPGLGNASLSWLRAEFEIGSDGEFVTVPIYTVDRTLVGYKRRTSATKFLSAPGSRLAGVLYGEWRDRGDGPVVLCEGETDTWAAAYSLRDAAPDTTVMGLSCGAGQRPDKIAERLAGRLVTLAFDGDEAGRRASALWAGTLRSFGCPVLIAPLPEGADVASLGDPALYLLNGRPLLDRPDGIGVEMGVYSRTSGEVPQPISNWSLVPEVESTSPDGARAYTGVLQPFNRRTTISSYDLKSKSSAVAWALRHGGAWYGTDRDAQMLLGMLQAEGPFLVPGWMATVAGLHSGHFVWPDHKIGPDNWRYVSPPNTVHLENRMSVEPGEWLPSQVRALRELHAHSVMDPILSWLALAPLRSLFRQFPILGVTGSSGSGKTTLMETVLKNFTGTTINTNLTSTTPHAVFSFVGSTNAFPVWFDEYRPGARKSAKETLDQVIRDAYTGQSSSKGGMGESWSEVTTVPAMCPLIVTGEDAFSETSHTERMILVHLPVKGKNPAALDAVRGWEDHGLPHAYLTWLAYALSTDGLALDVVPTGPAHLPSRLRYNLGALHLGWAVLNEFLSAYHCPPMSPPDYSAVVADAEVAADHSPIKDALLWVLEEPDAAEFIRHTQDQTCVAVRVDNFVNFVNRRGNFTLPGGAAAIKRYLIDHYGATPSRASFAGRQARVLEFPVDALYNAGESDAPS